MKKRVYLDTVDKTSLKNPIYNTTAQNVFLSLTDSCASLSMTFSFSNKR